MLCVTVWGVARATSLRVPDGLRARVVGVAPVERRSFHAMCLLLIERGLSVGGPPVESVLAVGSVPVGSPAGCSRARFHRSGVFCKECGYDG